MAWKSFDLLNFAVLEIKNWWKLEKFLKKWEIIAKFGVYYENLNLDKFHYYFPGLNENPDN